MNLLILAAVGVSAVGGRHATSLQAVVDSDRFGFESMEIGFCGLYAADVILRLAVLPWGTLASDPHHVFALVTTVGCIAAIWAPAEPAYGLRFLRVLGILRQVGWFLAASGACRHVRKVANDAWAVAVQLRQVVLIVVLLLIFF